MIGKQLDLFGGAPMPPKKIRMEEDTETTDSATNSSEAQENIPSPEPSGVKITGPRESPTAAVTEVFVQMPGVPGGPIVVTTGEGETQATAGEVAPQDFPVEALGELGQDLAGANEQPDQDFPDWVSDLPVTMGTEEPALVAGADTPLATVEILVTANVETVPEDMPANTDEAGPAAMGDFGMAGKEDAPVQIPTNEPGLSGLADTPLAAVEILLTANEETEPKDIPAHSDEAGPAAMGDFGMAGEGDEQLAEDEPVEVGLNPEEPGLPDGPNEADEGAHEAGQHEKGLNIPADNALYSRQYYTMRETSAMFNVNQSLLRFWENEFDILKPKKNRKGDRYFRPDDIKNLELIYHLLRVRKFTIEGAKEYLKSKSRIMETFEMVQRLEKLKLFLLEMKLAK